VQEKKRTGRSPNDPFDQQQESVSTFLGGFDQQQQEDISSLLNPQNNEVSNKPLAIEDIPIYPAVSLHSDTRVNDLLLENGRRGGLIMIEPDSEFIDKYKFQK